MTPSNGVGGINNKNILWSKPRFKDTKIVILIYKNFLRCQNRSTGFLPHWPINCLCKKKQCQSFKNYKA